MSAESDPQSPLIDQLHGGATPFSPAEGDSETLRANLAQPNDAAGSPKGVADEWNEEGPEEAATSAQLCSPSVRDSPPPPAFTHYFQTTVAEFVSTINVSVDCVVTNVVTDDCVGALAGLDRGCRISTVNGEIVSTLVDVKQLLSRLVSEDDAVEIGFLAGAVDAESRHSFRPATASSEGYEVGEDAEGSSNCSKALQQMREERVSPLEAAVRRLQPGRCIIIMAPPRSFPARQIEDLASSMGVTTHIIDLSVSIHRRPRQEQLRASMEMALQYGEWLAVLNATDSLSTLECLIELLTRGAEIHRSSRIFITTEPHPHFPLRLMEGAIVFRFHAETDATGAGLGDSAEGANDSDALSLKDSLTHMHRLRGGGSGGDSLDNSTGELPRSRRKVRINSVVDVVPADHSTENLFSRSQLVPDEPPSNPGGQPIPRAVRSDSQGLYGEKFTCMCGSGADGRLVAGSSGGNLYLMRADGFQELVFHAHPGCVWGIDAVGKHAIATASEDASVTLWRHDSSCRTPGFAGKILSRFSNDVLCVRFVEEGNPDIVCAGGLNGALLFVNAATMTRQVFPTVSTIRAMDRVSNSATSSRIAIAGGTGLVTMWDGELAVPVETLFHHRQQASTVCASNNVVYSGSFDATIAVSDVRTRQLHHRFKDLPGVVSALCVRDHYVAAASTTELLLFDARRPHSLLYRRADAWTGMCSGLVLDYLSASGSDGGGDASSGPSGVAASGGDAFTEVAPGASPPPQVGSVSSPVAGSSGKRDIRGGGAMLICACATSDGNVMFYGCD